MFPQGLLRQRIPIQPWNPEDEEALELLRRAQANTVLSNDPPEIQPVGRTPALPPYNPQATNPLDEIGNPPGLLTRSRIVNPPVSSEELDTTLTRPRIADRPSFLLKRRDEVASEPVVDKDGRLKSFLKMAGLGALRGLASGGLGGGIGGAIGGGLAGAIKPSLNERLGQQEELANIDTEIDQGLTRRGKIADLESQETLNQYRRAQIPGMLARPEQAQTRALNQRQSMLIRRLGLQGYYKRGEKPDVDAELDREFGPNAIGDFDKRRGQTPTWRSGDGLVWRAGADGTPEPVINPSTGQQMRSEGAISREQSARVRQENKQETTANRNREKGQQARTKITQMAGLLREGKAAAAAELEREILDNYGDVDGVDEAVEEAKKRNKYDPLDFPKGGVSTSGDNIYQGKP